ATLPSWEIVGTNKHSACLSFALPGSLRREREPGVRLVLLRQVRERRLARVDHYSDDGSRERERRFVPIRHGRASIAAHVEALVCREESADLLLEAPFADFLLAEAQRHGAASLELALLVDLDLGGENLPARRNIVGRRHAIARLVVVVVLPVQLSVLD